MDNLKYIGVEVLGWKDGVAYYLDGDKKVSVVAHIPLEENELCRTGKIYKVKRDDDYKYTIISVREDKPQKD